MNWYIGQHIIAIRNLPDGTKKGTIEKIRGLTQTSCCGATRIDIGRITPSWATHMKCQKCKTVTRIKTRIWWFSTRIWWFSELNFSPLESDTELSETTYEDIMTEIKTKELQQI